MRTSWMILGCLIVIAGCQQQVATIRPSQANRPIQPSDEIADEQDAEPAVVPASHETIDNPTGPRVVIIARHIDVMVTPPGQAALDQLWNEEDTAAKPETRTPRTRVLEAKDVLKLLATLDSQGLGRHTASPEVAIGSGKTGECATDSHWNITPWKITPTIQADGSTDFVISIASPNSSLQTKAAAQLRAGETLAIEGETYQTMVTEISRTPYFGELPIVGPLLFSNKRSTLDPHQSLYLVTVEAVDDGT